MPVVQIDRGCYNAIPVAFGALLAKHSGAVLWSEAYQSNQVHHTGATPADRFVHQPVFAGAALKGTCLICDDVAGYGATISNPRGFLETTCSRVLAATTIAAGYGSTRLSPNPILLATIKHRYGDDLETLTHALGFKPECLTSREAYFLNGLGTPQRIRDLTAQIPGA